jgi:Spy/CpxP family protein refolding chaperone
MDKPWKVILAFAGIFVAGILVGGLVTLRWGKNFTQKQPGGEQFGPALMQRLVKQLDLTPDQQAKVKPIVDSATEELRQLRRTTQRTTAAVVVRMQGDIAAVLTPDQKAKFDTQVSQARERIRHFMEERARRMKEREDRSPPPAPPQ